MKEDYAESGVMNATTVEAMAPMGQDPSWVRQLGRLERNRMAQADLQKEQSEIERNVGKECFGLQERIKELESALRAVRCIAPIDEVRVVVDMVLRAR